VDNLIDDFYLIHYGWLSENSRSGLKANQMAIYRSNSDPKKGKKERIDWHNEHTTDIKSIYMPTKPEWFW
jgi:hypothetical protein